MSGQGEGAAGLDALLTLPAEAMVPVGYVRGLIEQADRQRRTEAGLKEETIAMWCEIVTRNLCVGDGPGAAPEGPTGGPLGPTDHGSGGVESRTLRGRSQ